MVGEMKGLFFSYLFLLKKQILTEEMNSIILKD